MCVVCGSVACAMRAAVWALAIIDDHQARDGGGMDGSDRGGQGGNIGIEMLRYSEGHSHLSKSFAKGRGATAATDAYRQRRPVYIVSVGGRQSGLSTLMRRALGALTDQTARTAVRRNSRQSEGSRLHDKADVGRCRISTRGQRICRDGERSSDRPQAAIRYSRSMVGSVARGVYADAYEKIGRRCASHRIAAIVRGTTTSRARAEADGR